MSKLTTLAPSPPHYRSRSANRPLPRPWGIARTLCAAVFPLVLGNCAAPGAASNRRAGLAETLTGQHDAPWTILCLESTEPEGARRLREIASVLRRTPGVRTDEVILREDRDGSCRLYYGTYSRRADPRTGKRAIPEPMRKDLDMLRGLGTQDGRRFFVQAIPVRLPPPDVGPPEWDLRNIRATYSLQVGIFEPTDDFFEYKQAAVEFCELLRSKGHESYYYHTPVSSTVTVGAFGPEAVVRGADGRTYYSNAVRALQEHELLRNNLVNGGIMRVKNPQGTSRPVPSQLVEVPGNG